MKIRSQGKRTTLNCTDNEIYAIKLAMDDFAKQKGMTTTQQRIVTRINNAIWEQA